MLETFQGWGAIFYPKSFVKAVRDYASKNNQHDWDHSDKTFIHIFLHIIKRQRII